MSFTLLTKYASNFVREDELAGIAPQVEAAHRQLHEGTGLGNDFIGWLDLPVRYDPDEFSRIQRAARAHPFGQRCSHRHWHWRILSRCARRDRVYPFAAV